MKLRQIYQVLQSRRRILKVLLEFKIRLFYDLELVPACSTGVNKFSKYPEATVQNLVVQANCRPGLCHLLMWYTFDGKTRTNISLICDNNVTTQVSQHNSVTTQQCHNTTVSQHNSVTTQQCHNTSVSQHNSVTTQHCHNTTVSQLKICDFSGETFKGFEVL